MLTTRSKAISQAILAAALFGISAPVAKLLLEQVPAAWMASFLYFGAGAGMFLVGGIRERNRKGLVEARLTRQELPYILLMVLLDIAAPLLLMYALMRTPSANVSLLGNLEIAATSLIALLVFKEAIGSRMWLAIALITASGMLLSMEDLLGFSFSTGSLLVILACICWGLENNFTRKLSIKDPMQIVVIKGLGSGTGSALVALLFHQQRPPILYVLPALVLGFVAYGLSIYFYIRAQRELGAARTSAYYAFAPFIGVLVSFLVFGFEASPWFLAALAGMAAGAWLTVAERHRHAHIHATVTHEHRHGHEDGHHIHVHEQGPASEHSHPHTHEETRHSHPHTPDTHHTHRH